MTDLELELTERMARLEEGLAKLEHERNTYHQLYLEMLERNRQLERGLLAPKTERLAPDEQLSLSVLGALLPTGPAVDLPEDDEQEVASHKRRKAKRKPLPERLPRIKHVLVPPEVAEDPDAYEQIGVERTEVLERQPSLAVVLLFEKPKYVRKDRAPGDTTVYVASTPSMPIPRGLAGPGMLSDTIVKRWEDHQPLNRLERVYRRDGIELARSTMCGWHIMLAELCKPVVDAML